MPLPSPSVGAQILAKAKSDFNDLASDAQRKELLLTKVGPPSLGATPALFFFCGAQSQHVILYIICHGAEVAAPNNIATKRRGALSAL